MNPRLSQGAGAFLPTIGIGFNTPGVSYFTIEERPSGSGIKRAQHWLAFNSVGDDWVRRPIGAAFDIERAPLVNSSVSVGDRTGLGPGFSPALPTFIRTSDGQERRTDVWVSQAFGLNQIGFPTDLLFVDRAIPAGGSGNDPEARVTANARRIFAEAYRREP